MIAFERFILPNGLTVIFHRDDSTPMVAINLLYHVGAKHEDPNKTGFAHLFEHLMFGGSENIPKYDEPLERVGGENNAFTNNDFTNYYLTLPKQNIETGLWLESDRMNQLAFSEKSLDVQRNVVINEFKQNYLNQPYGDIWLLLRPLAYTSHPYQWATIGKNISHIEQATLADVTSFFNQYYCPSNAILTIVGDMDIEQIKQLTLKWFGDIPAGVKNVATLPAEPKQTSPRHLSVERDIPYNTIYKAYHMCARNHPDFYATDLLSDILSNGNSSRLYTQLVKKERLFSDINAYHLGHIDQGLFIISGKLIEGVDINIAEQAIQTEIQRTNTLLIEERELQKVKNKVEANLVFSEINILNKAMSLAQHELVGKAEDINIENAKYQGVTPEDIRRISQSILHENNCSTLYYMSKKTPK